MAKLVSGQMNSQTHPIFPICMKLHSQSLVYRKTPLKKCSGNKDPKVAFIIISAEIYSWTGDFNPKLMMRGKAKCSTFITRSLLFIIIYFLFKQSSNINTSIINVASNEE
jgi:hypothetical protein